MIDNNFIAKINYETSSNIGIDFDGVIHNNSKGYHDGTIYGEPLPETKQALKKLSEKYTLIIYTCKASPERPLVNEKTGIELIWEWLKKYNLRQYISDVTFEKPRVKFYIDDKGIEFKNWDQTLKKILEKEK